MLDAANVVINSVRNCGPHGVSDFKQMCFISRQDKPDDIPRSKEPLNKLIDGQVSTR